MDQNHKINHTFLEKSTKVGNDIHFQLSVYHDAKENLFFPKTNQFLGDFEITKKSFFPSKMIENGMSKDSIFYTLKLFSNKKINYLELPIYSFNGIDCTKYEIVRDSILLNSSLEGKNFQLNDFYQSIEIQPLEQKYNYPKIIGISLAIIIGAIILYLALKKPIEKNIKLFFSWRDNRRFKKSFEREILSLQEKESKRLVGKAFLNWKTYLEKLSGLPISTYTSKEIIEELGLKKRKKDLKYIDATIYGSKFDINCIKDLEFLFEISQEWYQLKMQEIRER